MKRSNITLPLVAALIITVISSCKKDVLETNEVPNTGQYGSLNDFYAQNGAGTQPFTITDLDLPTVIIGQQGTKIELPPNSLEDATGAPPAGDVNVTLREIYTIRDMVLSHVPTTSNGAILHSGGMFFLEFTANNIHYYPTSDITVTMSPTTDVVPGMQVFYGIENQSTGMNWVVDPSSIVFTDSIDNNYVIPFLDSLAYGWINCDKFYQVGTPVNFTITPLVDAERDETVDIAVYLLFPTINSAMNVSNTTDTQSSTAYGIPSGMQAVAAIVGVGRITNKAYFGKINFTAASQQSVSVSVVQMTDEQIYNSLSNL